jgi:hypothetical protein
MRFRKDSRLCPYGKSESEIMEKQLLTFFAFLEGQIDQMGWGTISGNILLINSVPKLETANIVKSKRTKYPLGSPTSVVEHYTIVI